MRIFRRALMLAALALALGVADAQANPTPTATPTATATASSTATATPSATPTIPWQPTTQNSHGQKWTGSGNWIAPGEATEEPAGAPAPNSQQ
jgi:hypothetical protein